MKKYYNQILIVILTLVLVNILASTLLRKPSFPVEDPSFTLEGTPELPDQILAIDMNIEDKSTINERDIVNGNAALIVFIPPDSNGGHAKPQFIKSFEELATLDSSHNGQIDPTDRNYKNIHLAYMQPEGHLRYVSLAHTGIYALFLHQSHIKDKLKQPEESLKTADMAVLQDSSKRRIVPILIGQRVLSKLNKE